MGIASKPSARATNVVERAIAHVGGSPAELGRRLGEYAGKRISRQVVNGWRMRGIFPRDMLIHVERLTGITVEELVVAQPRPRDPGNIVDRAMREIGPDTTAAEFAQALTKASGKRFTRQHVNVLAGARAVPGGRDAVGASGDGHFHPRARAWP